MSGHSKWATIKRKKEKTDSQRGKIFTKIGRELAIAVREGGPDPNNNNRLKDVIAKAKANNMPNENITRSIKKAAGESGQVNYEETVYEGYSAGGVAVIVEVMTDNRNRTASDVRHIFDKSGGSLGAAGCVGWMFERKGLILVEKDAVRDEDTIMLLSIEAGADDFTALEDAYEIVCNPADFSSVREALEKEGLTFISADIERVPQNTVSISSEAAEKLDRMVELLEDHDDVQNVFHNAVVDE
jgi:YebC/PmpR family DNA-binding regulatory protein